MRVLAMTAIGPDFRKMVSIEPVLDFEPARFSCMLEGIKPEFIYVGYDNHRHVLPEPPLKKTEQLMKALGEFTEVRPKTLRRAWWETRE